MKLAWLCYNDYNDVGELTAPIIVFREPDYRHYYKIVPIVYAEIVDE